MAACRAPGSGSRAEAEWEYAARTGNASGPLAERAWFRKQAPDSEGFKELNAYAPQSVAKLRADTRGLYDLTGNVWEWCSSLFRPYPYDARDGRESSGAEGLRVVRGGGYDLPAVPQHRACAPWRAARPAVAI